MQVRLQGASHKPRSASEAPKSAWEHLDTHTSHIKVILKEKEHFWKRCFSPVTLFILFYSAHIREEEKKKKHMIATIFTTEQTTWKSIGGKKISSTYAVSLGAILLSIKH